MILPTLSVKQPWASMCGCGGVTVKEVWLWSLRKEARDG